MDKMPPMYPTHRHPPEFWEHLGRTVATFGFLEEILGKAIFALTATRRYSPDEIDTAYQAWLPKLEHALTDTLFKLADDFGKAAKEHPDLSLENVDELVEKIKSSSQYRNTLCHGSWRTPDANGASRPFFVNRKKEVFETPIDIALLIQIQAHVAELSCNVVDTISHMGWRFPGSNGPGKPIWEQS